MVPCFVFVGLVLFVVFLFAQAAALRTLKGTWLVFAAVPAAVMLFVVLRVVVDGLRDPTSHNLWPFEILIWSVVGLGYLGLLFGVRELAGVGRSPPDRS